MLSLAFAVCVRHNFLLLQLQCSVWYICRFNLDELTSGTIEAVPSTIGIVEEETPKWADRHFDDGDFKSENH